MDACQQGAAKIAVPTTIDIHRFPPPTVLADFQRGL